jgi:hypothetical protein
VEPLLDFAVLYEIERYEGSHMKKEEYERMVNTARWLGDNIADGVAKAVKDPERMSLPSKLSGNTYVRDGYFFSARSLIFVPPKSIIHLPTRLNTP